MTFHTPPSRVFLEFEPGIRRRIEDTMRALINLLDELDGDTDCELPGDPVVTRAPHLQPMNDPKGSPQLRLF